MQIDILSKLSRLTSLLVNPLIIPSLLFWCIGSALEFEAPELFRVSVAAFGTYLIAPASYLLWLVWRGRIESLEARSHENRKKPLLLGSFMLIAAIPIMAMVWPQHSRLGVLISSLFALNAIILAAITLRFKISLHVSTVASLSSIMAALFLVEFIPVVPLGISFFVGSGILLLLVAWARIHQEAHSKPEVYWGAAYGLVAPFVELALLGLWLNP